MTENEAIHKLEYSKKAYQTLIDEKVDSGKLVGDGVRGEWKAETPLNEVYKSMIDALDMAIKALEAQPCEDCISRKQALKETKALIRGDYDPEYIIETLKMLPSVTPKAEQKAVLGKIRAEIEQLTSRYSISKERGGMGIVEWSDRLIEESDVLQVIDKYKADKEDKE